MRLLVSIIVPVFNRANFLEETVQSVLEQTNPNWELLLIDDGSTDSSVEIAESYSIKDERIRFFKRPELRKKGANACRNIGIEHAKGEFLIFLDSDDLLAPFCLEQRLQKAGEHPDLDFWVFPMLLFKERWDDMMILQNINTDLDPLTRFLGRENVWLMSSVLWRTEFVRKLGGYNENLMSFQDWEMNVRALCTTDRFVFFDRMLPDNYYRQHVNTISKNRYNLLYHENNLQMVLDVWAHKISVFPGLSDVQRRYTGGFVFEWLKRLSGFKMEKADRWIIANRFLQKGLELNLFTHKEYRLMKSKLKIIFSPLYARFSLLRKIIDQGGSNKKLLRGYYLPVRHQAKTRYLID